MDNYHYPLGADTEDAPWNQPEVPEKEFKVTYSVSLSKTASCLTDNYVPGATNIEYESDGEGGSIAVDDHDPDDTTDTNWEDVFSANHKTIPDLLDEFKKYLGKDLDNIDAVAKIRKHDKAFLKRKLERLIKECDNWIVDEEVYIKDDE